MHLCVGDKTISKKNHNNQVDNNNRVWTYLTKSKWVYHMQQLHMVIGNIWSVGLDLYLIVRFTGQTRYKNAQIRVC